MHVLHSAMLSKSWFVKDTWMLKILFCLSRINIYIYKMLADSGVECCMLSVQFDIAFYIRCYCNTTYV